MYLVKLHLVICNIYYLVILQESPLKTPQENSFDVSVNASANLIFWRMRICYQNNGGSSISKGKNSKLRRNFFLNFAPVLFWKQLILTEYVFIRVLMGKLRRQSHEGF